MTTEATRERRRRMRPDETPPPAPETSTKPRGKTTTTPATPKTPKAPKPASTEPEAPRFSQSSAGRPPVFEIPVIEGEVDDLPNATGVAKAMYRETVAAVSAKAEAGSKAWTIINPMGRKASTVQSGIKGAAKEAGISMETRIVGEDADRRVYVRVHTPAA